MSDNTHNSRSYQTAGIAVVTLVTTYFLSLAPVQWLQGRGYIDGVSWGELRVYAPIAMIADHCPDPINRALDRYAFLFCL